MAPPFLIQSTANAICKGQSRTVTATFTNPSNEKNLIVLSAIVAGGGPTTVTAPPGFLEIRNRSIGYLQVVVWYYPAAPAMNSVTVNVRENRSVQIRAIEYGGAAQSNVIDRVTVLTNRSSLCESGLTDWTSQPDTLVLAICANRHASTSQSGFSGGLTRLFETLSPQYWGFLNLNSNNDEDRSRATYHHLLSNVISRYFIRALLSSIRDWICILICFRGGSSGPKRMTSLNVNPITASGGNGGAQLSAFGPLRSGVLESTTAAPMLRTTSTDPSAQLARIGPFNYQYRLNGWSGLLIGSKTNYHVEGTDGLNGWQVRTSDDDLPRGDGALRGIDLEAARQVIFKMNVGKGREEVERNMDTLFRSLVPQRDQDWELIWRHPAQPLKMMRVRPIDLIRGRSAKQLFFANQSFALRAADPRHYSAIPKSVQVPITPPGGEIQKVNVFNEGNIPAYPIIRVQGPTSGPPVTKIELINETALVTFEVELTLPRGSVLIGDMEARSTGASRSPVTLDGQSKYGAWQLPREPFRIDPDPTGFGGYNTLYLRTDPVGAPVICTLDYRDTWAG